MDFEERMDRNLRGKVILLKKCQVQEEHIRRLEAELVEVKGHTDSINTIRNALAPLYKAAESPRWETKTEEVPTQNPLLIEDIVQCVVQYLDYRTKKSLRKVHSCWNNAILTPEYLNKTVLKIDDFWEIGTLFEIFPIKNSTVIGFPGSVAISNLLGIQDPEILLEWFGVYGKLITSMTIHQDPQEAQIFEKLLTGLLPNLVHLRVLNYISDQLIFKINKPILEKLESLEIGDDYRVTEKILRTNCAIVKSILNAAVNLKVLKLGCTSKFREWNAAFEGQVSEPLEYLKTCRDAGYLTNLVELDLFNFGLTNEASHFLSEVKLTNLKRLVLPPYDYIDNTNSLTILCENVKDTLEYLRVDAKYLYLSFLSQMKELKELKCDWTHSSGYLDGHITHIIGNYIFNLPKLETLIVESDSSHLPDISDQILDIFFQPYNRNDSIKSLEFINIFVGRRKLFKLLEIMQNLKSVKIKRPKVPQNLTSLEFFSKTSEKGLKERRVQIIDEDQWWEDKFDEDNDE